MNTKKTSSNKSLPVLYSLRSCPYVMRARIAIFKSQLPIELRDIVLNNKPEEMLSASAKGTVPVLVIEQFKGNKEVIDESLDIMLWALHERDPDDLLQQEHNAPESNKLTEMLSLIEIFDSEFKSKLEQYRCAKRYHETNLLECREACEKYLQIIEERLNQHLFIVSNKESLADIALLPFIRQFARVERQWYLQAPYPKLQQWLKSYLQSPMFTKVMAKHPLCLKEWCAVSRMLTMIN